MFSWPMQNAWFEEVSRAILSGLVAIVLIFFFILPMFYAGVQILENVGVERVVTDHGKLSEVVTTAGRIKCENFVNAGGMVRQ